MKNKFLHLSFEIINRSKEVREKKEKKSVSFRRYILAIFQPGYSHKLRFYKTARVEWRHKHSKIQYHFECKYFFLPNT